MVVRLPLLNKIFILVKERHHKPIVHHIRQWTMNRSMWPTDLWIQILGSPSGVLHWARIIPPDNFIIYKLGNKTTGRVVQMIGCEDMRMLEPSLNIEKVLKDRAVPCTKCLFNRYLLMCHVRSYITMSLSPRDATLDTLLWGKVDF